MLEKKQLNNEHEEEIHDSLHNDGSSYETSDLQQELSTSNKNDIESIDSNVDHLEISGFSNVILVDYSSYGYKVKNSMKDLVYLLDMKQALTFIFESFLEDNIKKIKVISSVSVSDKLSYMFSENLLSHIETSIIQPDIVLDLFFEKEEDDTSVPEYDSRVDEFTL